MPTPPTLTHSSSTDLCLPVELIEAALVFSSPRVLMTVGMCSRRFCAAAGSVPGSGRWHVDWLVDPSCEAWGADANIALGWIAKKLQALQRERSGTITLRLVLDGCPHVTTAAVKSVLAAAPGIVVSAVNCRNVLWESQGEQCLEHLEHYKCLFSSLSFAGRLRRLPSTTIGSFRCVDHYGIDAGSIHEYAPCGSFYHEGMRHLHGFVRSTVCPPRSTALASDGWLRIVLTYRPGDAGAAFNPVDPDIGAAILIRDGSRSRDVCHLLDLLADPIPILHDIGTRLDLEVLLESELEGKLPATIPAQAGVWGNVVLGLWERMNV